MITRDDWLRALDAVGCSVVNDPDALTCLEFCAMFTPPLDRNTGTRRLQKMVTAGLAIKTRKTVADTSGRMVNTTAYKLVPDKKKR